MGDGLTQEYTTTKPKESYVINSGWKKYGKGRINLLDCTVHYAEGRDTPIEQSKYSNGIAIHSGKLIISSKT